MMRGSLCTIKVERLHRFAFGPITQEPDYKSVCEQDYCLSELTSTVMKQGPSVSTSSFLWQLTSILHPVIYWLHCNSTLHCARCIVGSQMIKDRIVLPVTARPDKQPHIITTRAILLWSLFSCSLGGLRLRFHSTQRENTQWTSCSRLIDKCCITDKSSDHLGFYGRCLEPWCINNTGVT